MCDSNSNSTLTTLAPIVAHLQIQQIQPTDLHDAGENKVILYSSSSPMALVHIQTPSDVLVSGGWGRVSVKIWKGNTMKWVGAAKQGIIFQGLSFKQGMQFHSIYRGNRVSF